jgi:thymidine kinase
MTQPSTTKGKLEVICGSMFSGKSEELIRRLKRQKIARKEVLVIKPSIDTRHEIDFVTSHDGNKIPAYAVSQVSDLYDLITPNIKVVGVDEAQFFSHDLIGVILELLDRNISVIVAGLNLDFRAVPFGPMPTLMALADTVTKLSAICVVCGGDAFFSQRLVDGIPARYEDKIIQVGAQEAYQARCRSCYMIDKRALWQKAV